MKEQANVRSFRITSDVMSRFKEIQEEMSLTQDSALKMLVDAYEIEKAKNTIPDRKTEITNFQMKVTEITEAFIHSLQLNQDAEARIRNEVDLQLKSKDEVIIKLQDSLKEQENKTMTATRMLEDYKENLKLAELSERDAQDKLIVAQETARDKENINSMLTGKLAEAENKAEGYDVLKKAEMALKEKLAESLRNIKGIEKDAKIGQERAIAALQSKMDKEIAKIEREKILSISRMEKEIATVMAERENAITAAALDREQAIALVEREKSLDTQKLRDKIDILKDERSDMKDEISALKSEVSKLKTELSESKKKRTAKK